MRNTLPISKKFGSSNFNASTAYRNYKSETLNSLVVNQHRNPKHQLQQSPQPQQTNSSPKSFNANRSCEKCKSNHSLAVCPEYQLCPPNEKYSIVSKNSLCTNGLSNKHHKQTCPSTKLCQVCTGFHQTTLHDSAKQIKRPEKVFSTQNAQNISLLFCQTARQRLKIRSTFLRQKAGRIRIQTAATGNPSTAKTKQTLKDET